MITKPVQGYRMSEMGSTSSRMRMLMLSSLIENECGWWTRGAYIRAGGVSLDEERVSVVAGKSLTVPRGKQTNKGRKNCEPGTLPRDRDANTGSRISLATMGRFSVPIFVGDRVEIRVGPRLGEDLRCEVVSVLFNELTVDRFV